MQMNVKKKINKPFLDVVVVVLHSPGYVERAIERERQRREKQETNNTMTRLADQERERQRDGQDYDSLQVKFKSKFKTNQLKQQTVGVSMSMISRLSPQQTE